MREFDFDELDRAVHSVLGNAPAQPGVDTSTTPSNDSVPIASQSDGDIPSDRESDSQLISSHAIHSRVMPARRSARERPSLRRHQGTVLDRTVQDGAEKKIKQPLVSSAAVVVAPAAPLVTGPQPRPRPLTRRRSGKVMDIVHPASSSGLVRHVTSTQSTQRVKDDERMGGFASSGSLASSVVFDPVVKSNPVPSIPPQGQGTLKTVDSVPPSPTPVSTDARSSSVGRDESPVLQDEVDDSRVDQNPLPSVAQEVNSAPTGELQDEFQGSPFVSDAQVQKRPLGGVPKTQDEAGIPSPTKSVSKSSELGDDMQEKIRQIESMDFSEAVASEALGVTPEAKPERNTDSSSIEESGFRQSMPSTPAPSALITKESGANASPGASVQNSSAQGPTSITRQYKTEPRVASAEDTSPIFDPESYHQPLEHEPKRKSGWGVVVGILLLLVLGVGLAALVWAGILPVPL